MAIDCERIQRRLGELGVAADSPDFLNNTEWIAYVGEHPELLETFAAFVICRNYSNDYLDESERVIRIAAETLNKEIVSDGRRGACIDAAGVLSQILEKEGIWSFQVGGSLTGEFPAESGIDPMHFYSKDIGQDFVAAHSWVVAPPFKIIDVTIKEQQHHQEVADYLPDCVLQKEVEPANFGVEEFCSPRFIREAEKHGVSKLQLRVNLRTGLGNFHSSFPVVAFGTDNQVKLKYIPAGIKSFDGPLEANRSLQLNGRYGLEIYEKLIKPKV
jgi:hypothetical protein